VGGGGGGAGGGGGGGSGSVSGWVVLSNESGEHDEVLLCDANVKTTPKPKPKFKPNPKPKPESKSKSNAKSKSKSSPKSKSKSNSKSKSKPRLKPKFAALSPTAAVLSTATVSPFLSPDPPFGAAFAGGGGGVGADSLGGSSDTSISGSFGGWSSPDGVFKQDQVDGEMSVDDLASLIPGLPTTTLSWDQSNA
jgi:hypothetical protein